MATVAGTFMERIILSLLPFFIASTADLDEARAAIVDAIASYGARTQGEITEAEQILALGFCTVDSLAEFTDSGMSVNKRLRLRGTASALVRSKKSCQQALADSLYMEVAEPAQPDQVRAEARAAALFAAMQRMRDRAQQRENQPAATTPKQAEPAPRPDAPRPDAPRPDASRPDAPCPAAAPRTDKQPTDKQRNAMLWASVMNQVANTLVQENGPAPG